MLRGCGPRDSRQFVEDLDNLGVERGDSVSPVHASFGGATLADNLFAALEIYSKKLAEIRSLAVLPEFQGRGVGKQLVQACVDRARERNILEVMAVTSSEDFFRACGFDFTLPGEKKALFYQTREAH